MNTATIELNDIQGYIIRGYHRMQFSRNIFLQITDPVAARKCLDTITDKVTTAVHHPSKNPEFETCINIALTSKGLSAIGMLKENMQNFTREFREGMTTEHRQRLLGDFDTSAPANWIWGGPEKDEVHILVMIFAADNAKMLAYYDALLQQFSNSGLKEIYFLDGQNLPANREHFGFRDGIGQPVIAGSGRTGSEDNMIATGEFIMGYKNQYGVYPDTPLIAEEQGNMNLLPSDAGGSGFKDLGRNGSYLVVRQIKQDVEKFWSFMNEKTKKQDGSIDVEESTKLAAKMVGRWPSGAPLVKYPDKDPGVLSDDDEFSYHATDSQGLKCPFGSHIRRCNPRDTFEDNGPKESLRLSKRHRIIRRSKLYGTPFAGTPLNHKPEGEVGLLFMCFNCDISRQFEFIQYTWANYPKFQQLYNDPDPLIGIRENPDHNTEQIFTIQQEPVSKCITDMQRFVEIKGGAYFFFPSITALRYLASL